MPAPKGAKFPSRAPLNPRGGLPKRKKTFAETYAEDPQGTSPIRLSNAALAYFERQADEEDLTVRQYLERMEINSRIV